MDPRLILSALEKMHTIILIHALDKLTLNYDPGQPATQRAIPKAASGHQAALVPNSRNWTASNGSIAI